MTQEEFVRSDPARLAYLARLLRNSDSELAGSGIWVVDGVVSAAGITIYSSPGKVKQEIVAELSARRGAA